MILQSLILKKKYKLNTKRIIRSALKEDVPHLDVTSHLLIDNHSFSIAEIMANQEEIVCGVEIVRDCFKMVDRNISIQIFKKDGEKTKKGDLILKAKGRTKSILKAERTALNFLQHLSGIATHTYKMVSIAANYNVTILDTRKTIPGLRYLAKYAVYIGGGKNHRFHLSDEILIKENHIIANGGIEKTLVKFKKRYGKNFEIEVENLDELRTALKYNAPYILLDNFKVVDIKRAVRINQGRAKLEVSGGVTLKNIKQVARTGVDYISVGSITHSSPAVDFTLILRS